MEVPRALPVPVTCEQLSPVVGPLAVHVAETYLPWNSCGERNRRRRVHEGRDEPCRAVDGYVFGDLEAQRKIKSPDVERTAQVDLRVLAARHFRRILCVDTDDPQPAEGGHPGPVPASDIQH